MTTRETVKQALVDVYDSYKNKGLKTIYLYGSILTDDFNEASDIDSIGIVEDPIPVQEEDIIKEFLKNKYPQIKKFGFRFLYLDELNGQTVKGTLAKFIHPSILLLDFPNWDYVAGKDFKRKDFELKDVDFRGAIKIEIKDNILGWGWRSVSEIKERDQMYFLKTLAWIVYFSERDKGLSFSFSYKKVFENAQDEKEVMQAILAIKEKDWAPDLFKEKSSLFQNFIDKLDYTDSSTVSKGLI